MSTELPQRYQAAQRRRESDSRRSRVEAPEFTFTAPLASMRSGLGISLRQMADELAAAGNTVSAAYLSMVESGKRRATPELLSAIQKLLLSRIAKK